MLEEKIIEPTDRMDSTIVIALNKAGSLRFCVNFENLTPSKNKFRSLYRV